MAGPLRVSTPPYLVARPLHEGLGEEPGIELDHAVPAELVRQLRAGEVDVALVSSIELFRQPGYSYVSGPAVAGRGEVRSVQVFRRTPVADLRRVALDPVSRAAATLVRIVLPRRTAGPVEFLEPALGIDPRAVDEADAWLRIGDAALRETYEDPAPAAFNPSAAWVEDTGLPFVFAVWVVRPGVVLERAHLDAFAAAQARGTARLAALADEAAEAWNLAPEHCRRYLVEECCYDAGADTAPALRAFRDAAAELDLCEPGLDPVPLEPSSAPCRD